MKKLKVGIIGLGIGEKHIKAYNRHSACEVVALCDFSKEKKQMAKKKYPDIFFLSDANKLLECQDIDIVSIASYDNYHYEQVCKAIHSGKHVFVEKPLCLFDYEAKEIRKVVKQNNIKLSSNLNLRTTPRFLRLKDMIEKGELGEVFYVESDYNSGRLYKVTEGWRGDQEYHSVVYSSAVHVVDLLYWILDDLPIEVYAFGNKIATKDTKFRFNDFVVGLLRFKNNIIGKVTANVGCVHPHFHNLKIYGTDSTFINRFEEGILIKSRDKIDIPMEIHESYPGKQKDDIILSFVDSIIGGIKPMVSIDDVFNTMSICFAIEKSMNESRRIKIEYI